MPSHPTITVLTPTWNAAKFARQAARSVAEQTWRAGHIEHLVLDAGSSDQTVEEIRVGNPAAQIVQEGVRDGLYAALNRGLARSRGSFIAWLNADDYWRPNAIELAMSAFARDPQAELAIGDLERLWATGVTSLVTRTPNVFDRCAAGDLVQGYVTPLCCFWRRELIVSAGPYDVTFSIMADRDLWMRLASQAVRPRVVHIGGIAGTFRQHDGSLSWGASRSAAVLDDLEQLWQRWAHAPQATQPVRSAAHRLWQDVLFERALLEVRQGEVRAAARHLKSLLHTGRRWWRPLVIYPGKALRRTRRGARRALKRLRCQNRARR